MKNDGAVFSLKVLTYNHCYEHRIYLYFFWAVFIVLLQIFVLPDKIGKD